MDELNHKKFNFSWTENGINHPHHQSGEEWYENFDVAWERFKKYALDHLALGSNPQTGANGRVCRVFNQKDYWEYMLNLVLDDVLYIAFLSAKSEDVKDLKMAPSCNVMKDLLREKGLI